MDTYGKTDAQIDIEENVVAIIKLDYPGYSHKGKLRKIKQTRCSIEYPFSFLYISPI